MVIFTPAFLVIGYKGYKINQAFTFEVNVMIIAAIYNVIVIISTFFFCDDFMVLISEIMSSSILLYMFYRFQQIAFHLTEENPASMARLEHRKNSMDSG